MEVKVSSLNAMECLESHVELSVYSRTCVCVFRSLSTCIRPHGCNNSGQLMNCITTNRIILGYQYIRPMTCLWSKYRSSQKSYACSAQEKKTFTLHPKIVFMIYKKHVTCLENSRWCSVLTVYRNSIPSWRLHVLFVAFFEDS